MSTIVTTARYLDLASQAASMANQIEQGAPQLAALQANCLAAFETLTDKQILLQSAMAERATNEVQLLQLQKDIRQKMPKLNRLKTVLELATARLEAAGGEGEEQVVQAGKDYASAVEEHEALNAEVEDKRRTARSLESRRMWLNIEVAQQQRAVDQAGEAYGEANLTEEGFRTSIPLSNALTMAQHAVRAAAVELFRSK